MWKHRSMIRIMQKLRSIMCWAFQIIPRYSKAAEHAAAVVGGLRFPEFACDLWRGMSAKGFEHCSIAKEVSLVKVTNPRFSGKKLGHLHNVFFINDSWGTAGSVRLASHQNDSLNIICWNVSKGSCFTKPWLSRTTICSCFIFTKQIGSQAFQKKKDKWSRLRGKKRLLPIMQLLCWSDPYQNDCHRFWRKKMV